MSIEITALGTQPFTYQWRKNGTAISGATNAAYSIAAAVTTDSATYTAIVTNAFGSTNSDDAVLTVNASSVVAPAITNQPTSLTLTTGQVASFSVTASGSSLTYQWYKNSVAIPSATAATYSIASVSSTDAANYSVVISNSAGSITSSSAILTISAILEAPWITTQPVSLTVSAGQSASFFVTATGSIPMTYQWRKNGGAIPGATNLTYTITSASAADAASYSIAILNSVNVATSVPATLTVNSATTTPIVLDLTPQSFSARGQSSSNNDVAKLFDHQTSTEWIDLSASTWVLVTFASPTVLEAYSLTSGNGVPGNDPSSWTLSGSNNGTTWTVIESRNTQSWSSRLLARDFILAAPSPAFTQFRFDLNSSSGSVTQLAELELFGNSVTSVTLVPTAYSARGQPSTSQGIAKLFDNRNNTKWVDLSGTSWVKIVLSSPAPLRRYTLTSAADTPSRDPSSWTLSGSNDDINWTVIETRTNQSWASRRQTREFVFTAPATAFVRYRFDFRATSGSVIQLAELKLYGDAAP